MSQTARTFRLADQIGAGLSCDESGLFLGQAPLLTRDPDQGWRPRPLDALNAAGAASYGLRIDFAAKLAGLRTVAAALDCGEIALAKIAALHLRLPDPPPLAKDLLNEGALVQLASDLQASGVLAKDFDPDKHPRWPAGTPDHQGGQFAPAGGAGAPKAGPPAPAPKKPKGPQGKPDQASPLATSLQRKQQKLSPQSRALLNTLEGKLKDPSNQGVVTFDNRDDALKDMGYFFSADITRYDDSKSQVERGGWLLHDPQTGLWSYDRSQMQVGLSHEVSLGLNPQVEAAYRAGTAIDVHIHPLKDEFQPYGQQDNVANEGFSQPGSFQGQALENDADKLSAFSRSNGPALHAAVIGTNGSIWYADGGPRLEDYGGRRVTQVAPRGTVPMLKPGE